MAVCAAASTSCPPNQPCPAIALKWTIFSDVPAAAESICVMHPSISRSAGMRVAVVWAKKPAVVLAVRGQAVRGH